MLIAVSQAQIVITTEMYNIFLAYFNVKEHVGTLRRKVKVLGSCTGAE